MMDGWCGIRLKEIRNQKLVGGCQIECHGRKFCRKPRSKTTYICTFTGASFYKILWCGLCRQELELTFNYIIIYDSIPQARKFLDCYCDSKKLFPWYRFHHQQNTIASFECGIHSPLIEYGNITHRQKVNTMHFNCILKYLKYN
jgi:hypothetical protein